MRKNASFIPKKGKVMAAEIMARRQTFDGTFVEFWTDGSVTVRGFYVRGCGVAKLEAALRLNVEACWLLAGEVAVYERAELARAVKAARAAVRQAATVPLVAFRQSMA